MALTEAEKRVRSSILAGRLTPLVILGIFIYATWAMVSEVIIKQLASTGRVGPAIGVTVVYFLLLLATLTCYLRVLGLTLFDHPDYIPKGAGFWKAKAILAARDYYAGHAHKLLRLEEEGGKAMRGFTLARLLEFGGALPAVKAEKARQLDEPPEPTPSDLRTLDAWFATRDAFICGTDGRPAWCAACYTWKPERAHHCSDSGCCVARMDHFCPWIGGLVSASTFKFFVQFTFYCALLCLSTILTLVAVMATATTNLNPHHVVVLVLAGFFGIFTAVMAVESARYALANSSSIEWLGRRTYQYTVGAYIPPTMPVISAHSTVTYGTRKFYILTLPPGFNPFDLGASRNWRGVMGERVIDWFLPFRFSPDLDDPHAWAHVAENKPLRESFYDAGLRIE